MITGCSLTIRSGVAPSGLMDHINATIIRKFTLIATSTTITTTDNNY